MTAATTVPTEPTIIPSLLPLPPSSSGLVIWSGVLVAEDEATASPREEVAGLGPGVEGGIDEVVVLEDTLEEAGSV